MDKFAPMNTVQKPQFISELTSTSEKYQLNDIWRHLHPTTTDFTNITSRETLTFKTRTDYFLISESFTLLTVIYYLALMIGFPTKQCNYLPDY